ncbi:MAG TPA: HAD hydrolase-like protein, partial [Clostridia bacterium]|nr:HAD hydrolase-like protein [Clostridia bacterium]
ALVCREEIIRIMLQALREKKVAAKDSEISEIFAEVHKQFINDISDYTSLLPGVKNVLEALRAASVKMALVTSDSIVNTCRILEDLSIEEYFDAVIGKEATKEPKVSGIPAVEALRALKLEPEDTVCIGDAPMDALMSVNSGLRAAICVATGQTGYRELEKYTPYLLDSLQELKIEMK